MIIEALLEQSIIDALQSELGDDVQIVGSRLDTKVEDADKKTIVAVASAFRNHDAFSLSLINVPVAISVATRVEGDAQSQEHNTTVEKIIDVLVNWHKDGEAMEEALSNRKFLAGELRMDGGTTQTFDRDRMIWTDAININIRGAEKSDSGLYTFIYFADGTTKKVLWEGEVTNQMGVDAGLSDISPSARIVFGTAVSSIADEGFVGLPVTEASFNSGLLSIGRRAFAFTGMLTKIELPDTVQSIAEEAFVEDPNIEVTFQGRTKAEVRAMENYSWGLQNGCVIHCTDGDIVIGAETVVQYRSGLMRYLDIEGELTYNSIPSVIYTKEVAVGNVVTSIGEGAFEQCHDFTSVTIPGSVKTIGDGAFLGCIALSSVVISEGVETIEGSAFTDCRSISNIVIPSSVTSIGDEAFFSCEDLYNVTFIGKDKATVQGMENYNNWKLPSRCVIHCTDGDITI